MCIALTLQNMFVSHHIFITKHFYQVQRRHQERNRCQAVIPSEQKRYCSGASRVISPGVGVGLVGLVKQAVQRRCHCGHCEQHSELRRCGVRHTTLYKVRGGTHTQALFTCLWRPTQVLLLLLVLHLTSSFVGSQRNRDDLRPFSSRTCFSAHAFIC